MIPFFIGCGLEKLAVVVFSTAEAEEFAGAGPIVGVYTFWKLFATGGTGSGEFNP